MITKNKLIFGIKYSRLWQKLLSRMNQCWAPSVIENPSICYGSWTCEGSQSCNSQYKSEKTTNKKASSSVLHFYSIWKLPNHLYGQAYGNWVIKSQRIVIHRLSDFFFFFCDDLSKWLNFGQMANVLYEIGKGINIYHIFLWLFKSWQFASNARRCCFWFIEFRKIDFSANLNIYPCIHKLLLQIKYSKRKMVQLVVQDLKIFENTPMHANL